MKPWASMFAVILALFPLARMEAALAAVEVSRPVFGDTTWTCMDTIKVTGNVIVSASGRLTIQAGAVVLFSPGAGLFVQGQLKADGEREKRILFTCAADTAGGSPQAGQWNGLSFLPNSTGTIHYCDIRFAVNGVHIDQSSLAIYGCAIEDFSSRGISIDGSVSDPPISTVIERSVIRQNDTALVGSAIGIFVYRSADVTISRCEISNCRYGVQFRGRKANAPQFQMNGCMIRGHASYGIYVHAVG